MSCDADSGWSNIACPRFGGSRLAPSCCTMDRYRFCRKRCKTLSDHLQKFPNLPEEAQKYYKDKELSGWQMMNMSFANKSLPPDVSLVCKKCGFVAKSPRGLKSHMTRHLKRKG